jgi:hypothetical protein
MNFGVRGAHAPLPPLREEEELGEGWGNGHEKIR